MALANETTGHKHDGTENEGPKIAVGGLATNAVETDKIKNSNVTKAKIENLADFKVLGNVSGGAAAPAEVAILDEDNMASDSAISLATQQSIKAYIDSQDHAGEFAALEYNNSAKTNSQMMIAAGVATLSSGTIAVTGLPFSTSTSYAVTVTMDTEGGTQSQAITVKRDSASQITISDSQSTNKKVHWVAVGT